MFASDQHVAHNDNDNDHSFSQFPAYKALTCAGGAECVGRGPSLVVGGNSLQRPLGVLGVAASASRRFNCRLIDRG